MLRDVEDVCKDHLRNGSSAVCRNIGDDDTPFFGSFGIDNVISGGEHSDVFQIGQGGYGFCVEHNFVCQQYVCSGSALQYFGRGGTVVNGAFSQTFQFLPREVSGIGGIAV